MTKGAPGRTGWAFLLWLGTGAMASALEPCRIEIVEKGSGWPVPLVELRTTHNSRFISDNAGLIAFDSPELLGHQTWFEVIGHGYEVPPDGFGMHGVRVVPKAGQTLRIQVERKCVAKRLGRLTGGGLFAESQKLGADLDWPETGVLGCDSVQNAVHEGKMFWAWGDTTVPFYPLGIFDMTSATTPVQPLKSFEPPVRLKFDYFTNEKGAPRGVAKMAGEGPTWVSGYVSLPDKNGVAHLVANYIKVRNYLEAYEAGLCVWNETEARFEPHRVLWKRSAEHPKAPPYPDGHPAFWKDETGREWVLFGNPLPTLRCAATFEAWQDPAAWEVLTPPGTLKAAGTGEPVKLHTGSMAWNAYRNRWVTVFMQDNSKQWKAEKTSGFGELWYAESESPFGPWGAAVKVVTHANQTFYNPRIHPEMTPGDSPVLLFEGTYTAEFADHALPTPRFSYNQILYRLDLDDPALAPARH